MASDKTTMGTVAAGFGRAGAAIAGMFTPRGGATARVEETGVGHSFDEDPGATAPSGAQRAGAHARLRLAGGHVPFEAGGEFMRVDDLRASVADKREQDARIDALTKSVMTLAQLNQDLMNQIAVMGTPEKKERVPTREERVPASPEAGRTNKAGNTITHKAMAAARLTLPTAAGAEDRMRWARGVIAFDVMCNRHGAGAPSEVCPLFLAVTLGPDLANRFNASMFGPGGDEPADEARRMATARLIGVQVQEGASVAACDIVWALKGPRFGWLSDSPARVREAEDKVRTLQQSVKETTGDYISRFHTVFDTARNMGARVTYAEAVDLAIAGALMNPTVRFHLATAAVTRHGRDQDLRGITEDDADLRLQDLMTFTALPIAAETPTAYPTATPTLDRVEARDGAMEDTAAEMKAKRQAQDDQDIKKAAERDGGVNAGLVCPPANSGRSSMPCFTWMGSGHCPWDKACKFDHPVDKRGWCDKEVVCRDATCRNPRHRNPKSATYVKPDTDINDNEYSGVGSSFGHDLESSTAERGGWAEPSPMG